MAFVPAREQHHFANTVWRVAANGTADMIQTTLEAATNDPDRGDHTIWYRLENTPGGPVLAFGFTQETSA